MGWRILPPSDFHQAGPGGEDVVTHSAANTHRAVQGAAVPGGGSKKNQRRHGGFTGFLLTVKTFGDAHACPGPGARVKVVVHYCWATSRIAVLVRPILAGLLLAPGCFLLGQEWEAAQNAFLTGEYLRCLASCEQASTNDSRKADWTLLQAQALLAVGRYPEAEGVISNALLTAQFNLRLHELGLETAKRTGDVPLMQKRIQEINRLATARSWAYRDPPNLLVLGRVALLLGADPKTVLERLLMPARLADPKLRDAWLASGQLALDKHDYALAAKTFGQAQAQFPEDADVMAGLAQAYQPSSRSNTLWFFQAALMKNAQHVPSLLGLVDHFIDAEEYPDADRILTRALNVNPWQPQAWAYRAVLAHLRNDPAGEAAARQQGLKFWTANPEVDQLIGLKLSQKYRFAEGSTHQRQALAFEPDFLPARIQLAQDLLRLGEETEGWQLAEAAHQQDPYDVTAYNLTALHGTMEKFQTLTNTDFILRMTSHEAALYGERALALLQRAQSQLTKKYGLTLTAPTVVEIFPEAKDFGVRTFGMPHNPGFLGVCFGHVVTATSPAAQGGNPANWEAVLWHEFCHVVTLQLTRNKMPRWLSEGISVYEERQTNPAWGQTMNPRYRGLVLGDGLTPVGKLSSAFLAPESDLQLQFAYYESALVVEYLVAQYGMESLKAILRDLANGGGINDAIAKHAGPLPQIETGFAQFAKAKAEALGPGLDWKKPGPNSRNRRRGATDDLSFLTLSNPPPAIGGVSSNLLVATKATGKPNYWTLQEQAEALLAEKNWKAAKVPLETLIALCPNQSGPNNAYAALAEVHRGLHEFEPERAALEQWAAQAAAAPDAYLRLMELAEGTNDWPAVAQNAERFLAVNPLVPPPYRYLGRAREALGDNPPAIDAYQKLLLLEPPDPAEVHFRLARLLHLQDDPAAKRHVLQALEEAPRFRAAHRLLLEMAQTEISSTNAPPHQAP